MPLPLVLVEVVAENATPELTQALLRACTRATVGAECVLADNGVDESRASAVAIVSFSTPLLVRVQVGIKEDGRWLSRQLAFSPGDAASEIFTTTGFATGTLAGRVRGEEGRPGPPAGEALAGGDERAGLVERARPAQRSVAEPSASTTPRGPEEPRSNLRGFGGRLGPVALSMATSGPLAIGASVRGFYGYRSGLNLGASGRALRAARNSDGLVAHVWAAGMELGFSFEPLPRVSVDLAAGLAIERWAFDLKEPQGATARGHNDTLALRTSAGASALLAKPAALYFSPELTWTVEGTDVRVRDRTVLRTAFPAFGVSAGLELRFR